MSMRHKAFVTGGNLFKGPEQILHIIGEVSVILDLPRMTDFYRSEGFVIHALAITSYSYSN